MNWLKIILQSYKWYIILYGLNEHQIMNYNSEWFQPIIVLGITVGLAALFHHNKSLSRILNVHLFQ